MAKDRVGTLFEGDASDLLQEVHKINTRLDKMEDKYRGVAQETKKTTKEEKEFGRETKRALDEIRGPQQRYEQRTRALHALLKQKKITQEQFNTALRRTKERYEQAGRSGERAFGARALTQLTGLVGGYLSIQAAVGAITRGVQVWLENMREIAAEGKKAGDEMVALAALEEPGKKREHVLAATELGARYGVERGAAYNTIQAMKSATGSWEKGMKLGETVFAAKQAGTQLEHATEIATLTIGQGRDPRVGLRRGFVAGQASMRTPKELAPAVSGVKYWEDPELGWAVAATIAQTQKAQKMEVYTKRGGEALMRMPGTKQQEAFEKMGLGQATQWERLKALQKLGVTTPEAAAQFGFGDIRQREAISDIVKNLDKVDEIRERIHREAKPGLLTGKRGQVEREMPETRYAREVDVLNAWLRDALAFGPRATAAQKRTVENKKRALALRRAGQEEWLWLDLITPGEDPTLTWKGELYWGATAGTRDLREQPARWKEYGAIEQELDIAARKLNAAAENLDRSTRARPVVQNE